MSARLKHFSQKMDAFFGDASWLTRLHSARSVVGALTGAAEPVTPLRLQIEVTNRCNINCVMCSRHKHALQLGDLPSSMYAQVSELTKRAQETILFGYGEPLVSRAFYELLPLIRSSRFGFFTNGLAMTPRLLERIRSSTPAALSSLVFSIDGGTEATYNRIREKSSFSRVMDNLKAIAEYRADKNLAFELRVAFVAMKSNVRELPELFRHVDRAGVDLLHVNQLVVWDEEFRDESLFYHPEVCQTAFRDAAEAAEGCRARLDLPYDFTGSVGGAGAGGNGVAGAGSSSPLPPCRMPWIYSMISFDGDVRACCFAPEAMTMGSLSNSGFAEIWHSAPYRSLRESLRAGAGMACCLACENRFRSVPSPNDEATYIKLQPRKK